MKARFYIDIETEEKLNDEIQMELLVDIRNAVESLRYRFPRADIKVTRELGSDSITEAIDEFRNDRTRENCGYYDEAQGRHKCTCEMVKSNKCWGVCFYWNNNLK
jgi:hypothetical protein